MSNLKKLLYLILFGTFLGFILGLLFTVAEAISHHYYHYKLYFLLSLAAQTNLNTWIITTNALCLLAGLIYIFSKWPLSFWIKNNLYLNIAVAFIVYFSLLLTGKLLIPIYLSNELKQYIWLADIIWIFGLAILGILIIKDFLSKIVNSKLYRHLNWLSPALLGALLILNLGLVTYKHFNPPPGPNVIFLVIDALRPDHLSAYGYKRQTSPTIDKLAKQGLVFHNMKTNYSYTKPSIATVFTSLLSHNLTKAFAIMPNSLMTMAEIFKNNGYRTYYINGGNYLISDIFNYDQGFDEFTHLIPSSRYAMVKADKTVDALLKDIAQHKDDKFFAYAHLMDTHLPYHKNQFNHLYTTNIPKNLEPGKIDTRTLRKIGKKEIEEKNLSEYFIALYDGQIKYVDESIKKLLKGLKELNLLNNTIIVITSDHGEEFWEQGQIGHGHALNQEVSSVPFIIWGPGIKPSENKSEALLLDSLPTILGAAQVKIPINNFEGKNLLEREPTPRRVKQKAKHAAPKELKDKDIDQEKIERLKALGYL